MCHLEFEKEDIYDGFRSRNTRYLFFFFEFYVILESWASVVLVDLVFFYFISTYYIFEEVDLDKIWNEKKSEKN